MADFPTVVPTSRSFQPGDWPVKRFTSQNGSEVRVLRGNSRLNSELELTYDNIPDTEAEKFLIHYREVQGTFKTWYFPKAPDDGSFVAAFKGWGGSSVIELETSPWGMAWRYSEPPQIIQIKKGVSNVRLRLTGVLKEATTITSAASVAPIPPAPASVPRFTSFYGAVEWAPSADSVEVDWRLEKYAAFAAPTTIGVAAWTFAGGSNRRPGLQWSIAGFATTPQKFEIVCVDTTKPGASVIQTASTYTALIAPYQSKFLHWRVSGPASAVTAPEGAYRMGQRSATDPLPTDWSAGSLGHEYDTKKGSGNGWLGPFPTDGNLHRYVFVITAFDAADKAVANGICSSVGVFKYP